MPDAPTLTGLPGAQAAFNRERHDCNLWQSPAEVSTGTATATPIAFMFPDSDVVILGVEGLYTTAGSGAGADGSFKVGTKLGATTDDDAICGATTIDKDAADSVTGSISAATLLTTIMPAAGSELDKQYGQFPVVPAGTSVIVTHTQGASGDTKYKVQIRYKRIGKR